MKIRRRLTDSEGVIRECEVRTVERRIGNAHLDINWLEANVCSLGVPYNYYNLSFKIPLRV